MNLIEKIASVIVLSVFICITMYLLCHDVIPQDVSKNEWDVFVNRIFIPGKNQMVVLIVFGCIHTGNVILCFPFVNITQILYACFFGLFVGTLLCFVWEGFLVTLYVVQTHRKVTYNDSGMQAFIGYLGQQKIVNVFICVMQLSSVPLNAQALIIGYGNVTI